jgi:hypothetical protein
MGAPWAGVTTPPYASFGFDVHTLLQLFDLEASHTQLCRALQQRELAFITIAFVATRIILPPSRGVLSSTPNLRKLPLDIGSSPTCKSAMSLCCGIALLTVVRFKALWSCRSRFGARGVCRLRIFGAVVVVDPVAVVSAVAPMTWLSCIRNLPAKSNHHVPGLPVLPTVLLSSAVCAARSRSR